MLLELKAIGFIESPFQEKMGVPRQPNLTPSIEQTVHFHSPYNRAECFVGLSAGQTIWIIFGFHLNEQDEKFRPMVRPPRLGGNKKLGVFATRSPFRPNPLGLSAVRLNSIHIEDDKVALSISGGDFVNGTPVYDIKPYLPYSDCIADATHSFEAPERKIKVLFSQDVQKNSELTPKLRQALEEILCLDVGPAYKASSSPDMHYFRYGTHDIGYVRQTDLDGNDNDDDDNIIIMVQSLTALPKM